jgi:hypothetical protein
MRIPTPNCSRRLLFATALLLAAGCASAPADREPASGDVLYAPLNLRFGPTFEDLVRVAVRPARSGDFAVGYSQPVDKLSLVLHLYPRPVAEPEQHFKSTLSALQSEHAGARVEVAGRAVIDLGRGKIPGFVGLVRFAEDGAETASILWIIPAGERFVELCTSIPHDGTEKSLRRARDVSTRFLASLPLAAQ